MTSAARTLAATTLMLGLLPALIAAAPAGAAQAPSPTTPQPAATAPTPLSATASASPQVQPPAAPQNLVLQAASATGGPATARGEGKVSRERPATFLFQPEVGGLFSIGVSSPQNAARISVYIGDSTRPEAGTSQTDGAIRWSTSLDSGARVRIVVHTAGAEIPFRVEVLAGPGSV